MMLTILFSLFIALDLAALGLMFVLGLAAAGPSHTPMISVVGFFLVPAPLIAGLVLLYLRGGWPASRGLATVLAGLPAIVIVGAAVMSRGVASLMGESADDDRRPDMTVQRRLESAIVAGDRAAIARIAKASQSRLDEGAALVAALRVLEQDPNAVKPLQVLLEAGFRPDAGASTPTPLVAAIRVSPTAGAAPLRRLLEAGADPNRQTGSSPAWFEALAPRTDAAVLPMLLTRGANLRAVDMAGRDAVYWAAYQENWNAVALLLEQGANWQAVRMPDGSDLRQRIDARLRAAPGEPTLAGLAQRLRSASAAAAVRP